MTVSYRSAQEYQRRIGRFTRLMPSVVNRVAGRWAQARRAQLKSTKYPPKLPGQVYVRTGRLANSWGVLSKGNLEWVIRNTANFRGRYYSGYVVGRGKQAAIHLGRWWVAEDIVEERIGELENKLLEDLIELLR